MLVGQRRIGLRTYTEGIVSVDPAHCAPSLAAIQHPHRCDGCQHRSIRSPVPLCQPPDGASSCFLLPSLSWMRAQSSEATNCANGTSACDRAPLQRSEERSDISASSSGNTEGGAKGGQVVDEDIGDHDLQWVRPYVLCVCHTGRAHQRGASPPVSSSDVSKRTAEEKAPHSSPSKGAAGHKGSAEREERGGCPRLLPLLFLATLRGPCRRCMWRASSSLLFSSLPQGRWQGKGKATLKQQPRNATHAHETGELDVVHR
jgi:hypothetical protein